MYDHLAQLLPFLSFVVFLGFLVIDRALTSRGHRGLSAELLEQAHEDGRAEGRADVAARLRGALDPDDSEKLDLDALLDRAASLRGFERAPSDFLGAAARRDG